METYWQPLAQELRALWGVELLDAEVLTRSAPELVSRVGHSVPEFALETLRDLLDRYMEDKLIGALSAVLGVHPFVTSQGVTQRLTDFGQLLSPSKDERTVRRYANRGTDLFAEQLQRYGSSTVGRRPKLILRFLLDPPMKVDLTLADWGEDEAVSVFIHTYHRWYRMSTLEPDMRSLSMPLDSSNQAEEITGWVQKEPDANSSCFVELSWLSLTPLEISVSAYGQWAPLDYAEIDTSRASFGIRTEEDVKDYAHRLARSSLNSRDVPPKP